MDDYRKVFNKIPEEFDKWRPRYCLELFADVIAYADLGPDKAVLEIGPGTGQATQPILETGCEYWAIELGETFTEVMKEKFGHYPNFHIVNADFEKYDFGKNRFDLIYSAATIQWIPEAIGFGKSFEMLKSGGTLAMFMMRADRNRPGGGYTDEPLYSNIQAVYAKYFKPEVPYTMRLDYEARSKYGFIGNELRHYYKQRVYSAEDYASLTATHADHITLIEPNRSKIFEGIKAAINDAGGTITLYDDIALYLSKKP